MKCPKETAQARKVRGRGQEEVKVLEATVWAGWTELKPAQGPTGSAFAHHAVLQWHIGSAFPVIRRRVQNVKL